MNAVEKYLQAMLHYQSSLANMQETMDHPEEMITDHRKVATEWQKVRDDLTPEQLELVDRFQVVDRSYWSRSGN